MIDVSLARGNCGRRRRLFAFGLWGIVLLGALSAVIPARTAAEQASQPTSPAAGQLDAGDNDTCAVLADGSARCWGYGGDGELGYGTTANVGDDDTPASVGPLDFGAGRTVKAISAGSFHTCALLDDGTVRCWGYGANGRLGYGNLSNVDSAASVGPVDLGAGRTAVAVSAGGAQTCAIRDDGSVLCWGFGFDGQLGYGDPNSLGDTSAPGAHAPVDLGGHRATAISAGGLHTCAILDDGSVRCWGDGALGQLGYGDTNDVGATPGSTPGAVGPVNLGPGRTAAAISSGTDHTCAILDNGSVLCWGDGANGELGYGSTDSVGATQAPGAVGPVDLGPGRTAIAISAGGSHTCALLDNRSVRCWGSDAFGQLGYCNTGNVGDVSTPGSAGPVNLQPGDGGAQCTTPPYALPPIPPVTTPPSPVPAPTATDAARARALRSCLAKVRTRAGRRRCLRRYGRTPGAITRLRAVAHGPRVIELEFGAVGTDGKQPPAATSYVVKQSFRPIRTKREFTRAHALCGGACRFPAAQLGSAIILRITHLRARTTYYYAIAARDNVSARIGPRSATVHATTA